VYGAPARTFPAVLPFFRLDRIYVRGFRIGFAHAHHGNVWARISDHAVLTTVLERI
jgi:endonuclease/exonuclease/phosphatase family metal-dependent hydrolase